MYRGIILAGGKSSRFGSNKALASIDGSSFLERAASVMKQSGITRISLSGNKSDYSRFGYPVIEDEVFGMGPLGGLYSVMKQYPKDMLVVMSCDMPFVRAQTLRKLMKSHKLKFEATVIDSGGEAENQPEPFPGIYSASSVRLAAEAIASKQLSMRAFLRRLSNLNCISMPEQLTEMVNINRMTDLAEIRH